MKLKTGKIYTHKLTKEKCLYLGECGNERFYKHLFRREDMSQIELEAYEVTESEEPTAKEGA